MAKTDSTRGAPAPGTTIASAITLLSASLGMSAEAAPPTPGPTIHGNDTAASHQQKMSSAQHKKVKLERFIRFQSANTANPFTQRLITGIVLQSAQVEPLLKSVATTST